MENNLIPLLNLLKAKINAWCDNIENSVKNEEDLERAIELICETASNFGASTLETGRLIPCIQEKRIEDTLNSIKKKTKFKIQRKTELENDVTAKWELIKYNSKSFVLVELMKENYIHILGNDWNLFAYGYNTLRNAVFCWAEGRM